MDKSPTKADGQDDDGAPEAVAPDMSGPVPKPVELAQGSGAEAAPESQGPATQQEALSDSERKLYLLGFMPQAEIGGLVLGDLAEQGGIDRVRTLWLPRVEVANEVRQRDQRIIDDSSMSEVSRTSTRQWRPGLPRSRRGCKGYRSGGGTGTRSPSSGSTT
jgi:hypothetical protein